jgi:hypothetical protein
MARLSALTGLAESPTQGENVGKAGGLVEGEEDDEGELAVTPKERDLDDEGKEQIEEMLEKFIETHDKEDAEGDGTQR